ncbi:TBC1 domain family member 13 [Geodia barretti]|nr:TBC1 domain family member 13 [Geodia barretti]
MLSSEAIDFERLRTRCFQGCPDGEGIRATCWKILLGYLPPDTSSWEAVLESKRALYHQLVKETIINPHEDEESDSGEVVDHPLNPNPESSWNRFFVDNQVLLQIDHDTRRLYPDLSFFQQPTPYPRASYSAGMEALKKRVERSSLPSQRVGTTRMGIINMKSTAKYSSLEKYYLPLKEGEEAHWEVVERILFVHAKCNKGIGYVQGMNEVIGPLYYVFFQHPDVRWKEHAEADTSFCFSALMAEIGDVFTKKLDSAHLGIGGAMRSLMQLLKDKDPVLSKNFVKKGVEPQFFGFRWITLLLSQEFLLPELMRIWDSLFADANRFDFLLYMCCSMIISVREKLIAGDFAEAVKLLQHYPPLDIHKLLCNAEEIRRFHPLKKR